MITKRKLDRLKRWAVIGVAVPVALMLSYLALAGPEPVPSQVSVDRFGSVPVDMATGELEYFAPPDIGIKSRGFVLSVGRNYRSGRQSDGPFGYGWSWNHGEWLEIDVGNGVYTIHTPTAELVCWKDLAAVRRYAASHNGPCHKWSNEDEVLGEPDYWGGVNNVAWTPGMYDITQPLAAGNWGFSDVGTIQEVYISCFGATEYDWEHPTKGVRVRLSADLSSTNYALLQKHAYDCVTANITGDEAAWTWSEVNNMSAIVSRDSIKAEGQHSDVYIAGASGFVWGFFIGWKCD